MKELIEKIKAWKKLLLHFDNAKVHKSSTVDTFLNEHKVTLIPHPPYSPDISPCDFFLFGTMKKKLEGFSTSNFEELKIFVEKYLKSINRKTMEKVMEEWKKRLKYVYENNGEYYNE